MQQRIYQVRDVDELKLRLINVWHGFEQSVIDDAHSCVAATISIHVFARKEDISKI